MPGGCPNPTSVRAVDGPEVGGSVQLGPYSEPTRVSLRTTQLPPDRPCGDRQDKGTVTCHLPSRYYLPSFRGVVVGMGGVVN